MRKLSVTELRRLWFARSVKKRKGPAEVLRQTGWIYSAGSACPYLAFRARIPECRRAGMDRAFPRDYAEAIAVRACTMLVPRDDLPLALACGRRSNALRFRKLSAKCRVSDHEILELAAAARRLLEGGPLPPDELRAHLPPRLIRNLGDAGRNLGDPSTLGIALRELQVQGAILRLPQNGRLDARHHVYKLLEPQPEMMPDNPDIDRELARRFFHWAGPATVQEFAWWAGLGQRAARDAMAAIHLETVSVQGWSEEAWLDPAEEDLPEASETIFLPFRDNYIYFRRGLSVFVLPENAHRTLSDWKNRLTPVSGQDTLHHHAIVAEGRLVGAWEYDPDAEKIVWLLFEKRKISSQVAALEKWIAEDLGDVNFYADSLRL